MTNLQQAYLERMHATSGYGRISETGAASVHLPVNPLPQDTLNNLQAQSDQVLRRVAALESSMTEVTRRLDDWTEVTRGGIADLRSEIGAVKLEQRFAQTLRSSGGDATSARQTPLAHSVATGTPQGRSEASVEVMGEELKKRLEVYERKLSAIHSEHMFDAATVKERLENAVRESENHISRADELQALMKEEQGRRTQLLARLEAVEASVQDLRTSQRDFASTPEATENLIRAEMQQEVQRLRADLASSHGSGGNDDAARRCEELDRRMSELQKAQFSETAALRQCVEASVRGADALQRRCDLLESRFETKPPEDLIQSQVTQESTAQLRNELRKEVLTLRDELERRSIESHQTLAQMEASSLELSRKQEASERQLLEWKQDHLSETVALRGRLEETVGEHQANQVGLGDIKQEVHDERHRRREEMCAVRSRLEALEKLEAAPRVSVESRTGVESREDIGETRASVARLAKDLKNMREEHDQAISSLGSLTELVAKTATAGIQRSEERLAADLTGKRRDFERALVHHREQMEREAKAIISEVKNLSPTLMAGGAGGLSGLDGEADRMEVALRHIDNLARELRGEVMTQMAASAATMAQMEGNFNGDVKRMGGILADCVSQVKGIQVELSKLTLSKLEPRLASVESSLAKIGAMQDEISESTDTGKSRSPTDTSSEQGMKWLTTLSKVQMACGPSLSGVATPLANNSRGSSRGPMRQGLKDRLHGIHTSIYQVLGQLESYGDESDSAVLSSNDGGGSMSVPLPFRPEGTFEKQLRESQQKTGMGDKGGRLFPVNELRGSHDNLHFETKRENFMGLSQTVGNSPRDTREVRAFGTERSPSPSALRAQHATSTLQNLVNAATGPPRVATKGFTAPPSTGASRDLSPTRGQPVSQVSSRPSNGMNIRPSMVERQSQGMPRHSNGAAGAAAAAPGYRPAGPTAMPRQSCGYPMQVHSKASPQVPHRNLQWQTPTTARHNQLGPGARPTGQVATTRRAL